MSNSLHLTEERRKSLEDERQEAVDKIFELRDIIRHLEEQVKSKGSAEEELRDIVNELELIVKHQSSEESSGQKDVSDVERLHQYVGDLESEVQKLRLSAEIAGSEGAVQQIKNHLCEIETTLDKRTKELEGLHSATSGTTCSSPSEDMSIRDVVHQERTIYDECEVPLQQLSRLKEKLLRHSRAEDAAVKRIRDLELQVLGLKSDLEESQTERDILKKQISDHLVLISNLQIRLDEQRIRAEHIEKQTNTSLEVQNYDLKNVVAALEEKIAKKDKTINQLKVNIEETKKRLEDAETAKEEEAMVVQMQEQLEFLRGENLTLKQKLEKEKQSLPNLVESIISEKNQDLEKLREELEESRQQLQTFLEQQNADSLKKVSMQDLENYEQGRREMLSSESLALSPIAPAKALDETILEVSSIEKTGPQVFYSLQMPSQKGNSTEKHVRFEDDVQVQELRKMLSDRDLLIEDLQQRLRKLEDLEATVEKLQVALEATEASLKKATESFHQDQKENDQRIKDLRLELASTRCDLTARAEEVEELTKEVQTLRKSKTDLKGTLKVKEGELKSHEEALKVQDEHLKKLQVEIEKTHEEGAHLQKEIQHLQLLLTEKDKIIEQMEVDSKSLHVNLETIQNKLQETGNVVDLSRRLREEQKKNSDLFEEVHELKAQLLGAERRSLEDIQKEVQRELDYSAYLDSTLINAVSDGSLDNEDLEAVKLHLRKQKSVNKHLVKMKEAVERKLEDLEKKYEKLKKELDCVHYEDAVLIGELRTKLEKALHKEVEFDRMLKSEKDVRVELEGRLKAMKKSSTKANSLPDVQHDYRGLTRMISTLEAENEELKKEIRALHEANGSNLELKNEEIARLEKSLSEVCYSEQSLKENVKRLRSEMDTRINETVRSRKIMEVDNERKKLPKTKPSDPVTDQLLAKIQELNEVVKNDRQLMAVIERLRYENGVLEERVANLEQRKTLPFDDPISRANYLFAKYLRSESYRKALAFQKRYLISLLETYQQESLQQPSGRTKKPKTFKSVASMVVAVCRMKYLVRRWHSGKRITEQRAIGQVQFQVGQPVSSQNFAAKEPKTEMPWYGTSPPSKEPVRVFSSSQESKRGQKRAETSASRLAQTTLTSPAMLSKYIERFNQIQDRLGLDGLHS